MSLTHYAEVDSNGLVLAVYGSDGDPPNTPHTLHEIQGWEGMPAAPSPRHVLEWNNGAIRWKDPRTASQAWAEVRAQRDALLAGTDKHWIRAQELAGQVLAAWPNGAWAAYRQALRDITNQPDPFNITWPTPPNA